MGGNDELWNKASSKCYRNQLDVDYCSPLELSSSGKATLFPHMFQYLQQDTFLTLNRNAAKERLQACRLAFSSAVPALALKPSIITRD